MNKSKPREQTIYWDLEPEFLYDYLFFASVLRLWPVKDILEKQKKYQVKQYGSGLCFITLFEIYQKSLEDLGAVCLALKRRFNVDLKCNYQKNFSVQETPIIFTLINYQPGSAKIKEIIGNTDTKIEKNLNLSIVNQIDINLLYPKFYYLIWKRGFINQIDGFAKDQDKRYQMYMKIKHGAIIVSNGRILKSSAPLGPAMMYKNSDKTSNDLLLLHSVKYTKQEFELMGNGIETVTRIIRELIAIYLIRYYPIFLTKDKKMFSSLELLKKIQLCPTQP